MRNFVILVCFLILCCGIGFGQNKGADNRQVISAFCDIPISDHLKQANTTFTDVYTFKVDKSGKAVQLRGSRAEFTKLEDIEACLSLWKLNGFANETVFHVEFSWKHGIGWTQMRISSKDFSQVTIIGSKACPDHQ